MASELRGQPSRDFSREILFEYEGLESGGGKGGGGGVQMSVVSSNFGHLSGVS